MKVYVQFGPESALQAYKNVHLAFILTFTGATNTTLCVNETPKNQEWNIKYRIYVIKRGNGTEH
jgi:hypothetical protein